MKTNEELLKLLEVTLAEIKPLADSGDADAQVELAFGKAIHWYMMDGGQLEDLDIFKPLPADFPHHLVSDGK